MKKKIKPPKRVNVFWVRLDNETSDALRIRAIQDERSISGAINVLLRDSLLRKKKHV